MGIISLMFQRLGKNLFALPPPYYPPQTISFRGCLPARPGHMPPQLGYTLRDEIGWMRLGARAPKGERPRARTNPLCTLHRAKKTERIQRLDNPRCS